MSNSPNIAARARSWTRRARTSLHLYSDDNDDWISLSTKLHMDKQTYIQMSSDTYTYTHWNETTGYLWMWNQNRRSFFYHSQCKTNCNQWYLSSKESF